MARIDSIEALEALYGTPSPAAIVKETRGITPEYRALIEAAPFVALATAGAEGLDCSPRGDVAGFVRVADPGTLLLPDRRGNNRVDSLRNIVRDPRVALLFLIPGLGITLRVNGRAELRTDAALLQSFVMEGKAPRCVVVVSVEAAYFQCSRAIQRADLWNPARQADPASLPSAGSILTACSGGSYDGARFDRTWPEESKAALW